jgi:hypothetical protein
VKLYSVIFRPRDDYYPAHEEHIWENLDLAQKVCDVFSDVWFEQGKWFVSERQEGPCKDICGSKDYMALMDLAAAAQADRAEDRQIAASIGSQEVS